MPTIRGRRALAACLLILVAWLATAAVAGASPADPPESPPPTPTTPPAPPTPTTQPRPVTTTTRPPTTTTTATTAPSTTTTTAQIRAAAVSTPARPDTNTVTSPPGTSDAAGATSSKASVSLNLDGLSDPNKPSQSLLIIVLITLLSVAPALLIMLTGFTRIVIVLSLTRNALGLHTIPPNQVIVGLAMFLSFFVMSPTFSDINKNAVQPLLHGQKTQAQAYDAAVTPLRTFMLKQTRKGELALFSSAANGGKRPDKPEDVGLAALIPAFILSELKTAFIIGFVIFIPFLVIDIVVSSSLMSMGMMMLPPVFVSLPFKLLLFVMVDGWGLIVRSLLKSFA
jgi:flagellar biosynthetic protein FliP